MHLATRVYGILNMFVFKFIDNVMQAHVRQHTVWSVFIGLYKHTKLMLKEAIGYCNTTVIFIFTDNCVYCSMVVLNDLNVYQLSELLTVTEKAYWYPN